MKVNSEAVYGAKPSPFPYEFEWGAITTKPGKLYLNVIDWPKGEFMLYGLKSNVKVGPPARPAQYAAESHADRTRVICTNCTSSFRQPRPTKTSASSRSISPANLTCSPA